MRKKPSARAGDISQGQKEKSVRYSLFHSGWRMEFYFPGSRKPGEKGMSEKGQTLSFESQLDVIKALGDSEASLKGAW